MKLSIIKKFTYVYLIPLSIIIVLNSLISIKSSTYFELYMQNELPSFIHDNSMLLIIVLLLWIAFVWWINFFRVLDKIPYKVMCVVNCIYVMGMCLLTIWIFHCGVVCDSMYVNNLAVQFMEGDYTTFFTSGYYMTYPYQLNMALYFQLVYSLFGVENYVAFEILNSIFITLIIFMLQRITYELFENEQICKWEIIFSMLLFPLFLYSTFVYGDIPGFAAAIVTVYFTIKYLKTDKLKYAICVGFCLSLGLIVKTNNNIFLIAVVFILILKSINEKKGKVLIIATIICILSQVGTRIVETAYLNESEYVEMPKGTPLISFIVMGIQDNGDGTSNGPGWHNGFDMNVYQNANYDYDLAYEMSVNKLKEAALEHVHNPMKALNFFYRKYVSQWNDPTYQSLIMNEWYSRHVEQTSAWEYFNYGKGRDILFNLMNGAHTIMLAFMGIGLVIFLKKWSFEGAFVLMCVFGGMMFHEFVWEAKGRYVLPYYVLLVPFAAFGCVYFLNWINSMIERYKEKRNISTHNKVV